MCLSYFLRSVFDHDLSGEDAATRLTRICQDNESVAASSIMFRSLAGETGWSQAPLITLFYNALIKYNIQAKGFAKFFEKTDLAWLSLTESVHTLLTLGTASWKLM